MKSNKFPCLWEMLTFYDGGQVQLVPKWVVLNTRIDSKMNLFTYSCIYLIYLHFSFPFSWVSNTQKEKIFLQLAFSRWLKCIACHITS